MDHISSNSNVLYKLQRSVSSTFTQKDIQLSESINQGTIDRYLSTSIPPPPVLSPSSSGSNQLSSLQTHDKSSISCPTCSLQIGYIHNLHSKFIYDRNIQSMVDKIFPLKKSPNILIQNNSKIESKRSFEDSQQVIDLVNNPLQNQNKMKMLKPNYAEEIVNEEPEELSPTIAESLLNEFEFIIKVIPIISISPRYLPELALPPLPRPSFKGNLLLKASKITSFIFRRLNDEAKANLNPEKIELIFNDKVIDPLITLGNCDLLVEKVKKFYLKSQDEGSAYSQHDHQIYISYQMVKS